MSPQPDRTRQTDRERRVARPVLTRLRPAAKPDGLHVYAVHPGALPAEVWRQAVDALPEDIGFALLDLQNVPEYFLAALAPGNPAIGMAELADRCLAALLADHPEGAPFALVGWSFGGVVAYGMASEAAGLGDRLTELVLLDSIAPVPSFQRREDELDPGMLLVWFAMYLGAKRNAVLDWAPQGGDPDEELAVLLRVAVARGVLPADTGLAGLRKLYDTYLAGLLRNNRITLPYLPAPLDRNITLLKPAGSLLPDDGSLGWDQLTTRSLHHVDVPGDHYTMLRDPAALADLAALLTQPAAV